MKVVNAIMTLDGFMGILHERLWATGKINEETDDKFRDNIASRCAAYGTLRDAAFALKHGELTGRKSRVVRRPDQLQAYSGAFDKAVFDRSAFQTEDFLGGSRRSVYTGRRPCKRSYEAGG